MFLRETGSQKFKKLEIKLRKHQSQSSSKNFGIVH